MLNRGTHARARAGLVAGAATIFASLAIAQAYTGPPVFDLEIGEPASSTFGAPINLPFGTMGIAPAVGPNGRVHVLDPANDRVQIFSPDGEFIREFGGPGTADGDFDTPSGIAVGPNNQIYVGDAGLDRVQEFDSQGNFVRKWGSSGAAEGQFGAISAIAVNQGTGNVFVLDTNPDRIQEFGSTGALVQAFGSGGATEGKLADAQALAFDSAGGLWVADTDNNRVQKFDADNVFVQMWGKNVNGGGMAESCITACLTGTPSSDPDAFDHPVGISVDSNDVVFITDLAARIQQFSIAGGTFGTAYSGAAGTALGQFDATAKIGALAAGGSSLFVADPGNERIQVFSIEPFPTAPSESDEWGGATAAADYGGLLATATNGNVYVPDDKNDKVLVFSSQGQPLDEIGSAGTGPGEFTNPAGVALAPDGSVYVTDQCQNQVEHFAADGTFIAEWGPAIPAPAPPATSLNRPTGVVVGSSGDVFVADTGNDRVIRFDVSGTTATYVSRFGSPGTANGQLDLSVGGICPNSLLSVLSGGLAVAPNGGIWVADTGNDRIQRFDPGDGAHLQTIGGFSEPIDIALDLNDDLWISDNTLNKAFNLSPEGTLLTSLGSGSASSADDSLNGPVGISIDGERFWLTLDFGSAPGRVRKYIDPVEGPITPPAEPGEPGGGSEPPPTGGSGGGSGGFDFADLDEDAEAGVLVKDRQRVNKLKVLVACVLGPCDARVAGKAVLTAEVVSAKKKSRTRKKEFKLKGRQLQLDSGQTKKVNLKFKQRKRTIRKINRLLKRGWEGKVRVLLRTKTQSGLHTSRETIRHIRKAK